jgi:type III restriction enzyme
LGNAENIVVINDEAHHAWRITPDLEAGLSKDEKEEATVWVGGLDRIHNTRGILTAYDFSATPFVSTGHGGVEDMLFSWIVSDFGLNDAIESGLVKTPRVVIRDDGALDAQNKSKFYRLYSHVREDLTRKEPETTPLPDLVKTAYTLLGKDWLETLKAWQARETATPPVMITVANRTETAARIKYAFDKKKIVGIADELCEPDKTLHIDSKVLDMVENEEVQVEPTAASEADSESKGEDETPTERKKTKKELAFELRDKVDTVGKAGKPGASVRNVISVGMLTEGWDAKTVTHIMGLRAFSSQLLCEQVVGRGLRRTSYDVSESGLFEPEYVNIFGIPFTFMPHEDTGDAPPKPTKPKFTVEVLPERRDLEITFPNVLRIEQVFKPRLDLNLEQIPTLTLNAYDTPTLAELAPVLDGKPDINHISEISLQELGERYRTQKIIFETAISVYEQMQADWKGNKEYLLGQVIAQVERFINSDKIQITPPLFYQDDLRRRLIITLNLSKVGEHIKGAIRAANTESLELVVDTDKPLRSTADMLTWYTSKPWEYTKKSHINRVVFDSRWEATEAYELERNANVTAWAKNDHLGFVVYYTYQGTHHTFYPDYLVRLSNGKTLVLEVKGQDDQRNRTKRQFLDEWTRAVNAHGGFGQWAWAVSLNPADLPDIIKKHSMEDLL